MRSSWITAFRFSQFSNLGNQLSTQGRREQGRGVRNGPILARGRPVHQEGSNRSWEEPPLERSVLALVLRLCVGLRHRRYHCRHHCRHPGQTRPPHVRHWQHTTFSSHPPSPCPSKKEEYQKFQVRDRAMDLSSQHSAYRQHSGRSQLWGSAIRWW